MFSFFLPADLAKNLIAAKVILIVPSVWTVCQLRVPRVWYVEDRTLITVLVLVVQTERFISFRFKRKRGLLLISRLFEPVLITGYLCWEALCSNNYASPEAIAGSLRLSSKESNHLTTPVLL